MKIQRRKTFLDDENQLLLPLFIEMNFDKQEIEQEIPIVLDDIREEKPDLYDWTDDDIVNLHKHLFEQSLEQALNPRSSKQTRLDVLGWVDRVSPRKGKPEGFSFDACCKILGYDSEELREELHSEMKFRGIHPIHKTEARTPRVPQDIEESDDDLDDIEGLDDQCKFITEYVTIN